MSTTIQTREALPTGTWALDPAHSRVEFGVDYMVGTFHGSFLPFDAQLEVGEDGEARLTGSARVEAVRVGDENLTAHLLAPDFFDAERAPEISFASTAIRRSGDEVSVEGELTIKGRTQPVELSGTVNGPLSDPYGNERVGLKLAATIDRTSFGIDWNTPLPSGEQALADDVAVEADLYLVRAA
jgi:polyisoprenoid-binding protein YceI